MTNENTRKLAIIITKDKNNHYSTVLRGVDDYSELDEYYNLKSVVKIFKNESNENAQQLQSKANHWIRESEAENHNATWDKVKAKEEKASN